MCVFKLNIEFASLFHGVALRVLSSFVEEVEEERAGCLTLIVLSHDCLCSVSSTWCVMG